MKYRIERHNGYCDVYRRFLLIFYRRIGEGFETIDHAYTAILQREPKRSPSDIMHIVEVR